MTSPHLGPPLERIEPDMFAGPKRLAPLMPLLRRLPPSLATEMLAAMAVGDGVLLRRRRLRAALAWASAHGTSGTARWQLALEVLANHGRFVAQETMLGVGQLPQLRRHVVIEGAEHLAHLTTGAIVLGFHLGPPRTALVLRACGYPVRFSGRLERSGEDARWQRILASEQAIRFPASEPGGRAEGLYRMRNLLLKGGLVYLAADGPFGREAFRLPVTGGELVIRKGWVALRQITGVPTLPILTYRRGTQRVIVVHPPLPDPHPDPERDLAVCRSALAPLVDDYVRRFPSQCRYVAFPLW